jgi:hypothetical protein
VISPLKCWLVGTHQEAVNLKHLDYYLDEFTSRFNRRKSRSRGKLFFRLLQRGRRHRPGPVQIHDQMLRVSRIAVPRDVGATRVK